jgi:hypothetical protein
MSRKVQLVVLCEDKQHEVFVRRFLNMDGWPTRRLRVEIAPPGRGAAEQYVRERFPIELSAYRTNRNRVAEGLIVMVDGDKLGVNARMGQLDAACRSSNMELRQEGERVAIFVPTWNIETWLAYLDGTDVDETKDNYPRLNRERDCQPLVNELHRMCEQQALRKPSPPSLDAACEEYRARL